VAFKVVPRVAPPTEERRPSAGRAAVAKPQGQIRDGDKRGGRSRPRGGWGGVQGPEPGPTADVANLTAGCVRVGSGLRRFRGFSPHPPPRPEPDRHGSRPGDEVAGQPLGRGGRSRASKRKRRPAAWSASRTLVARLVPLLRMRPISALRAESTSFVARATRLVDGRVSKISQRRGLR